ncbi:metal-dependent hydrolase [Simiduia curdlanivorans]|uniref:Metal-dependent hydrolase n=1 Tax=Simiduia curdlanivorans TaxID=1492769 RepID=A0ABV8V125_9GAMM|nr:metal-dependent hydrolase [Simiduia curdlanivorans]MDN3638074.1 metal-dependent hydrolase [Simiduia curdlanivorans]
MDPITQGVLGATLPQAVAQRQKIIGATVVGALAGMAPDLDVLIRSSTDPLLFLEFHRQFTHSLFFIPVGGLICGLVLHAILGRRFQLNLKLSIVFSTLGYATHALLDACTTFGTQLFWPLSSVRVAWNNVSVIDPLFTLPLLVFIYLGCLKRRPGFAQVGLVWALAYLSLGIVQRDRAEAAGWAMAQQRNHEPINLEAKPTFANLWLWKIVYETEDYFYVDAVRVLHTTEYVAGEKAKKLNVGADFPWLLEHSQQAKDIARFHWFSNGYLAIDNSDANRIIDARYSLVPNQIKPLWGITLDPNADERQHVIYFTERDTGPAQRAKFFGLLFGHDQAPVKGAMDR